MRAAIAALILLPALGPAKSATIMCPFTDEEQKIMVEVLEVVSGAEKSPRGGLGNANVAGYFWNKFQGKLPNPSANCAAPPPPPAPSAPPPAAPPSEGGK